MMNVTQELESRFLLSLHRIKSEIEVESPQIRATVRSIPIGSLTEYQGHSVGIECILPAVASDMPDNLALIITVKHLTTVPQIDSAGVYWGHPAGYVEVELFPDSIVFSHAALDEIESSLPKLLEHLKVAIKRGRPPD